jgi:Spy/CpxP family protein refolding chaperone
MKRIALAAMIICALPCVGASSMAQEPPPAQEPGAGPIDEELGQAIREHFLTRLRAELALTDEQMTAVTPLVEEIESVRSRLRRERVKTVRALNRGMEDGAGDAELQGLLDRLDAIEEEQRAAEASVMVRVDEQLTVRQRVQFRFYTERFRRNLERRIEDLRRDRRGPANRRGPAPRVPAAQRP